LRIDSEGLDIAFQERFVIVHYRAPALLAFGRAALPATVASSVCLNGRAKAMRAG
jgi:hypothetical protein